MNLLDEIRDCNMTYLVLAQRMIREDRAAAMYRLGVTAETADMLVALTTAQLLKIAGGNLLLCRFRLDDEALRTVLSGYVRGRLMVATHAAVLTAGTVAA